MKTQEMIEVFPILSSGIKESNLTTLTVNSCLIVKADNLSTLLQKLQQKNHIVKFGSKSRTEIKKIVSQAGLVINKNFELSDYQKIVLKEKISAN
jgi:hypothetical protein